MSPVVYAIIVLGALGLLFILAYSLNRRTPKPEGCRDLEETCHSCPITTCKKNTNKEENDQ